MRLMKTAAYALLGYVAYELALGFFEETKPSGGQSSQKKSGGGGGRSKGRSGSGSQRRGPVEAGK
jgi:hypothetical protein